MSHSLVCTQGEPTVVMKVMDLKSNQAEGHLKQQEATFTQSSFVEYKYNATITLKATRIKLSY